MQIRVHEIPPLPAPIVFRDASCSFRGRIMLGSGGTPDYIETSTVLRLVVA